MNRKATALWGIGAAGAVAAGYAAAASATLITELLYAATTAPDPVADGPDPDLVTPDDVIDVDVIATDGTRLSVAVSGPDDGDPVLLVHGWTCAAPVWNIQRRFLTALGYRVYAMEQRGHGNSDLGTHGVSVGATGDDISAVLNALISPDRRVLLVGHSLGGMALQAWAARHPDEVATRARGVVLISTGSQHIIERLGVINDPPAFARPLRGPLVKALLAVPVPIRRDRLTTAVVGYAVLGPGARQVYVDATVDLAVNTLRTSRTAWAQELGRVDVRAGLEALSVPTSVLVGQEDRLTPVEHHTEMAQTLRANGVLATARVYPGAGHMLHLERAEEVNSVILDVLNSTAAEAVAPPS